MKRAARLRGYAQREEWNSDLQALECAVVGSQKQKRAEGKRDENPGKLERTEAGEERKLERTEEKEQSSATTKRTWARKKTGRKGRKERRKLEITMPT